MEDKNSKNSMKLSIEEWDNLLVFFNRENAVDVRMQAFSRSEKNSADVSLNVFFGKR